jgi:hypothetical protein
MSFAGSTFGSATLGDSDLDVIASTAATPERVLFLSPREFDLATLAASSAVASLPVTNLQDQDPARVWRTTSTSAYVDVTAAVPVAWNAAAMSGFTLGAGGQWRLKAYATAADVGVSAALDTGWQSIWPQGFRHSDPAWGPEVALLRVDNDAYYRWWRLEFADPGSDASSFDIGRLALGRAAQFSIDCDFGHGISWAPNDIQEPNGWGQIFTEPRPANRLFEMTWSALGQREVHEVAMELTRLRGLGGDIFCFLDPGAVELFHKWSMQALFSGRADYKSMPSWVTDHDGELRMAWGFSLSLIQKR